MEDSPAIRLKLFIDTSGLTTTQFADMCGIPRPSLSQILSGRNKKISDVFIGQIHRAFPDLSVVWLLFGEGPVRLNSSKSQSSTDSDAFTPSGAGEGTASSASGLGDIADASDFVDGYNPIFGNAQHTDGNIRLPYGARNAETRPTAQVGGENSNLSGLRNANLQSNTSNNQLFESDLRIMDLQRQIEQMRQNPRKVVQITIYYDDSTFETFTPKS